VLGGREDAVAILVDGLDLVGRRQAVGSGVSARDRSKIFRG